MQKSPSSTSAPPAASPFTRTSSQTQASRRGASPIRVGASGSSTLGAPKPDTKCTDFQQTRSQRQPTSTTSNTETVEVSPWEGGSRQDTESDLGNALKRGDGSQLDVPTTQPRLKESRRVGYGVAADETETIPAGGHPSGRTGVLSDDDDDHVGESDDEVDEETGMKPSQALKKGGVGVIPSTGAQSNAAEALDIGEENIAERKAARKLLRGTKVWFETSLRGVVVLNAKEIGFQQVRSPEEADILWVEATNAASQNGTMQQGLKPHQKVNFFPRCRHMATKVELARAANRVAALFPDEDFSFIPQTYIIPGDEKVLAKLQSTGAQSKCFVVKPSSGCGGDGIYLTQDVNAIRHPECVVQEYVSNPLLLGGLKFDLRVYVLVTSIAPLRLYVCREGLARMAVEPYEPPSKANYHKLNMHLTNYSLNKFSSSFVDNTNAWEDELCSKRSITTAFRQLQEQYGEGVFDPESVWGSIEDIAEKTLTVITPELMMGAADHTNNGVHGPAGRCFQLIGFDILLDENLEPHLLEINHHPSLQTDAPIDMRVKSCVLKPLVRMVSYDARCHRLEKRGKEMEVSVEEWEDQFRGGFGELCDGASYRHIAEPFLVMKDRFIETCTVGSQSKMEMSRSRLLKFCRRMGWVQAEDGNSIFPNSAEVDLIFMKRNRSSGSPNLSFFDFVSFLMEDVGNRLFPGPLGADPFTQSRLLAITQVLRTAPNAVSSP